MNSRKNLIKCFLLDLFPFLIKCADVRVLIVKIGTIAVIFVPITLKGTYIQNLILKNELAN